MCAVARRNGRNEAIAPAIECLDGVRSAEQLARGMNRSRHDRVAHRTPLPQHVEQLVLRDDTLLMPDQIEEHVEYLRLRLDDHAAMPNLPGRVVYLHVGEAVDHGRRS